MGPAVELVSCRVINRYRDKLQAKGVNNERVQRGEQRPAKATETEGVCDITHITCGHGGRPNPTLSH